MWKMIRSATVMVALLALTSFTGCNKKSESGGRDLQDEASILNPVPEDTKSIDAQLQRFEGQTSFLNYSYSRGPWDIKTLASAERAAAPAGGREIQESDVFKAIKGEKLLLLLNNARGVQTVSFKNGLEKPELLGRSGATGNYSEDMYYDSANKLVYVLERYWFDENDDNNWQTRNSRILTYALDKDSKPTFKKALEVKGEIAQHKMVGDVLYVATTEWPSWFPGGDRTAFGNIFSFKPDAGELKQVDQNRLTYHVSGRENLNIVETTKEGKPAYYLIAVLSESRWNWWESQNSIEVVDISDPAGKIAPVMLVQAKGRINEKTNTYIKNDTLIVVSNYTPKNVENARARIAVETFRFPQATDKELNDEEFVGRSNLIAGALRRISNPDEREKKYKEMIADPALGLKDVVVKHEETDSLTGGMVVKTIRPIANSTVTVGDTQGLNAVLQDVRVLSDQLYAFWVPQNNIDPLDVFDISAPEKEVKHIGFTNEIEGWVERSFPIEKDNRKFIVGLGWTIPRVNNEQNKRFPQAVLFEVKAGADKVKIEPLSTLVMDQNPNVWTNFNSPDKFVEFRMSEDGNRAVVLFRVDSWAANSFGSGGQLLEVDFEKALADRRKEIFKQGAVIAGGAGWLRRVFTNPEFDDVVNTFNDLALGTFKLPNRIGEAGKVEKALSILELARNIQGYVTLKGRGPQETGVQIVSNNDDYYGTAASTTSLRVVDPKNADAEKPAVKNSLELKGPATSSLALKEEPALLVLGVESKWTNVPGAGGAETFKYYTQYTLARVRLVSGKLKLAGTTEWVSERQRRGGPIFFESARMFPGIWWGGYGSASLVQTDKGVFVNTGTEILAVNLGGNDISLKGIDTKSCIDKNRTIAIEVIGDKLYATSTEFVEDKNRKNITYARNFLAAAEMKEGKLACKPAVNIPGKAVAFTKDNGLVTEDSRLVNLTEHKYKKENGEFEVYYEPNVKQVLASLVPSTAGRRSVMSLVDIYPEAIQGNSLKQLGDSFVFMEQYDSQRFNPSELNFVELDKGRFRQTTQGVPIRDIHGNEIRHWTIAKVVPDSKNKDLYLALLVSGRRGAVVSLDPKKRQLKALQVRPVGVDGKKADKTELFTILDPWSLSYGDNRDSVNFSEVLRSFQLSQGTHGVTQIYLE